MMLRSLDEKIVEYLLIKVHTIFVSYIHMIVH